MRAGEQFLFEGAQGTMLDIDHGTYPYVLPATQLQVPQVQAPVLARKNSIMFWVLQKRTAHVSEKVRSQQNL